MGNDSTATSTDEFRAAAEGTSNRPATAAIAAKYGISGLGLGLSVFGIHYNSNEAWQQLQSGHVGASLWTATVRNLPEIAAIAEIAGPTTARAVSTFAPSTGAVISGVSKLSAVKIMAGPIGFLGIEAVQQLVNETTGWVPPSILAQYSFNADINRARARDALFPGDATIEATTRNEFSSTMTVTENGPLPSEMMALNRLEIPEPAVDALLARMPQFATYTGNFVKAGPNGELVADTELNEVTAEMYRLGRSGDELGPQNARQAFRNYMIDQVVERAEQISLQRGTNDWEGERVPQEIINEAATQVVQEMAGDGQNSIGRFGAARLGYLANAAKFLNPAYDSPQTITDTDGNSYSMLQASAYLLDQYITGLTTNRHGVDWESPEQQQEMRAYLSENLTAVGFSNVPNPNRTVTAPAAERGPEPAAMQSGPS